MFHQRLIAALTITLMVLPIACISPQSRQQAHVRVQSPDREGTLKNFLRQYVEYYEPFEEDMATRYWDAFVDLNNDGEEEAIVYLIGRAWCGSGGCTMLILTLAESSWNLVTQTTITRPPINVLESVSHGWRNLSVYVAGGGINPGYEAELEFDGKAYPSNPSIPPAHRFAESGSGNILIPRFVYGQGDKLLFQGSPQ